MSVAERRVHPGLRGILAGPIVGYDLHVDRRAVHFGLPSTTATVILAFDEPLDTGWAAQPERSTPFWRLAAGLHSRPSLVHTHGRQHGVQLALTPLGVRAIFGLPIAELSEGLAHHDELSAGIPAGLHERLADAPEWHERLNLLERWLLARVKNWRADGHRPQARRVPGPHSPGFDSPDLARAWALLTGTRDRVEAVADEIGWSRRQLARRCTQEFGLSPKRLVRVARFERSWRSAASGTPLADVAALAGYADQSHLANEWRELAGRPPLAALGDPFPVRADPVPFLQDATRPHPEPSTS
ncbi:AraC family transcriptional regulator [Pseudoclavibacter endophyticus]|nr:helix-turn-helix domain-containing protein [Pseudoclavibacter endophyticus]